MENSNEVEVKSISLTELLKKTLNIPEYQRQYVWTQKEINKLLNQISEHNLRDFDGGTTKSNFYLGSIVLHYDGSKHNVIDGQQRITTMQILDKIKSENNYDVTYSHPITFKHIQENFIHFNNDVIKRELDNALNFDNINVTLVITKSEDLAYNFFETLNTGGKRLGGTDILKAHHLRTIKENDERNSFAKKWEKRQKNLEAVNRMLCKIRRMDYLNKHNNIPDKFANDSDWKNVLTEDFAENTKKGNRDIGYSFVEIEENTHRVTADKYSIRQPLNEGGNYINYLLNFTEDYNYLFVSNDRKDVYTNFNTKVIDNIDGTADLRSYYQLALMCFVDRFGRKNILEFSLYLFRFVYCLRLGNKSRIYEATVRNYINETLILDRILNAFTYDELISYVKKQPVELSLANLSGVRLRFFELVKDFFGKDTITVENFDAELKRSLDLKIKK